MTNGESQIPPKVGIGITNIGISWQGKYEYALHNIKANESHLPNLRHLTKLSDLGEQLSKLYRQG